MTPQDTMRLALEALEDSHQNINPERGFADELEKQIEAAIKALKAALAQPTCKQDLPVENEQERYVRMCPDIECGRKKQCTRMVGVSCMSRADIAATPAPKAQPDDAIVRAWQAGYYHAGYTHDHAYADKMAREYAGAAPAAHPDARKVVEQMVEELESATPNMCDRKSWRTAIQAGQKWLEENK